MSRRDELKKKILQYLLQKGHATRPELVALTGVRAATVFEAIDELKSESMIAEPERRSKKTGRKAPELSFKPDCCLTVGIELRSKCCYGVIADTSGKTLFSSDVPANNRNSLSDVKNEILLLLQNLREQAGVLWDQIKGIGFADPGLVDIEKGFSIRAVNVPGWQNVDTAKWLTTVSALPAGVWPETMVKTKMEYLQLADKAPESIFNLTTDDGIGGGFIRDGKLFTGASGRAMEIGHLQVDPDGPRCQCGNNGCLEALAGWPSICRIVAENRMQGVDFGELPEQFSMTDFSENISKNKGTRIIAEKVCHALGTALSSMVMMLNPEMIVISGELTVLGDFLLNSLRRELELRCFPEAVKDLQIVLSTLSKADTATGAAMMMREKILLGENNL